MVWTSLLGCVAAGLSVAVWFKLSQPLAVTNPTPPTTAGAVLGTATEATLRVGKLTRSYNLYIPADYTGDQTWPLVMAFHGEGATAADFSRQSGLTEAADRYHFIVAFAEGTRPQPTKPANYATNPQSWNDGLATTAAAKAKVDDVGFARQLVADVSQRYRINARQIYAVGYSNGGALALRLRQELPRQLAAVAVVSPQSKGSATGALSTSTLVIQGTADPLVPLATSRNLIAKLASLAGCQTATSQRSIVPGVRALTYPICPRGVDMSLVVVTGMGHTWPGGTGVAPEILTGPSSAAIEGHEVVWQFLAAHQL